jgi:cytosine/uracil/thiamine/allantoin permease
MKLVAGIMLLVVGIGLLIWGAQAADSLSSEVSEFFTGNPTDESMWLILTGIAAIIGGGTLAALGAKKSVRA